VKTLLIGIGNPGRQDDGLGPALVERLAGSRAPERSVVQIAGETADAFWAYQLNIEDAAALLDYDRVVFADATEDAAAPAGIAPLAPAASIAFTTHEMSPASVLALAEELYGRASAGFLLQIRGAEWGFAEGLSAAGERGLGEAERLFRAFIEETKWPSS